MEEMVPKITKNGKRWFSTEQKLAILKELESGVHFAELCRKYNINSNVLYRWKSRAEKLGKKGLSTNEEMIPKSRYNTAMKKISELERALGRKTLEYDILKNFFETKGIKLPDEK